MREQLEEFPSLLSVWVATPSTTNSAFFHFIYIYLYHVIPGILFDIYLKFIENPRRWSFKQLMTEKMLGSILQ